MATINYAAREISVKIVYYGPGLSGKTTNLQIIHRKIPQETKSDMVSLATETDRTLFFDFLPLDLGKIRGFTTKFQLYTVPGQVYYNATRKLVLRGVDGIVFIADSAADKMDENLESFQNMEENLTEYGYKRESIPIILQYNKRDLPNALPVQEINSKFNKYNLPWSEAISNKGKGVFESLKLIGKLVIDQLNQKYAATSQKRSPVSQPKPIAPPVQQQQQRPMQQQPMQPRPMPQQPAQQQRPMQQQSYTPKPASYATSPFMQTPPAGRPQTPPPQPKAAQPANQGQYQPFNLEPMVNSDQGVAPAPQQSAPKGKDGDFDIELSRYYEQFGKKPQQQPQQQQQQFAPAPSYGQPQPRFAAADEPYFGPPRQQQQPSQRPAQQPMQQQQQYATTQPPQYQNYPGPAPYGSASQQQPEMKQERPVPINLSGENTAALSNNEPLYFTSINTDKFKKKGKKPVNPRTTPKRTFLGKLFNRDVMQ